MKNEKLIQIINKLKSPKDGNKTFAIITKNNNEWFDESNPSGRIQIIGYCDNNNKILEKTEELNQRCKSSLNKCGEFADTLVDDECYDYITI